MTNFTVAQVRNYFDPRNQSHGDFYGYAEAPSPLALQMACNSGEVMTLEEVLAHPVGARISPDVVRKNYDLGNGYIEISPTQLVLFINRSEDEYSVYLYTADEPKLRIEFCATFSN